MSKSETCETITDHIARTGHGKLGVSQYQFEEDTCDVCGMLLHPDDPLPATTDEHCRRCGRLVFKAPPADVPKETPKDTPKPPLVWVSAIAWNASAYSMSESWRATMSNIDAADLLAYLMNQEMFAEMRQEPHDVENAAVYRRWSDVVRALSSERSKRREMAERLRAALTNISTPMGRWKAVMAILDEVEERT